jgi:hypothetical protein
MIARLHSARFLNWVMDLYPDVAVALGVIREDSLAGRASRAFSRFVLRRSDCVIALGETMARRLENEKAARIAVIHEWVDGLTIAPRSGLDHPLRAEWGWDGRFVVLYSGIMGRVHELRRRCGRPSVCRRAGRAFAFIGAGASRRSRARRRTPTWVRPLMLGAARQNLTAADSTFSRARGGRNRAARESTGSARRPCVFVGPAACGCRAF